DGAGRPGRPRRDPQRTGSRTPEQERTAEQRRYDGPPLPEDITGRELDPAVRRELRSLPDRLATRVARHLVAAGQLLDSDPETAYQHTLAARARATRLAVVREACGEAAYLAGHFAEALTELRAARRMSGAPDYLPLIADSERALGRPERALALARDPAVEDLDPANRVEMLIVVAGARRDLGQPEMAVRLLEVKDLHSSSHAPWAARLRYAYADALLAAGRDEEAVEWFHRTVAVDAEHLTDATERLAVLERAAGGGDAERPEG
ncbi:MAG: tetratricopeptide repeat protein, partial [Actinomycetota bacterium]|nr:tetratricopeptide repeat protein [Actinomycetota bacterium]